MVEKIGKFAKVSKQISCVNVILLYPRYDLGAHERWSVLRQLTHSELQQCYSAHWLLVHIMTFPFMSATFLYLSCQISGDNHFIWYSLQSSLLLLGGFSHSHDSPQHISQSGVAAIYIAE